MNEAFEEELERRVLGGDADALRELEAFWSREGFAVSAEVRQHLRCTVDECELDPHAWLGPWCVGPAPEADTGEHQSLSGQVAHEVRVRCAICFRLEQHWGPWDVSALRLAEGFSVTRSPS